MISQMTAGFEVMIVHYVVFSIPSTSSSCVQVIHDNFRQPHHRRRRRRHPWIALGRAYKVMDRDQAGRTLTWGSYGVKLPEWGGSLEVGFRGERKHSTVAKMSEPMSIAGQCDFWIKRQLLSSETHENRIEETKQDHEQSWSMGRYSGSDLLGNDGVDKRDNNETRRWVTGF